MKTMTITRMTAAAGLAALALALAGCSTSSTAGLHVVTPTATAAPATASPPPATYAPFHPRTLLTDAGTGDTTTPSYTVPAGKGDYSVYWTFTGNAGPVTGEGGTFSIVENNAAPVTNSTNETPGTPLPYINSQESGSGSSLLNGDPGTHSLTVDCANCHWTVKVVTEP
jgi:hypothetical protein